MVKIPGTVPRAPQLRCTADANARHCRALTSLSAVIPRETCPRESGGGHPVTRERAIAANRCRLRVRLLVLPVAHQIVHHGRVGEGGGVAEIAVLVLGDLAQNPPHDLAGAS